MRRASTQLNCREAGRSDGRVILGTSLKLPADVPPCAAFGQLPENGHKMIEIAGYPQFWGCHICRRRGRICGRTSRSEACDVAVRDDEVVLATIVTRMSNLGYLLSRFSRFPLFLVCAGFSRVRAHAVCAGRCAVQTQHRMGLLPADENIAQMLLAGFEGDAQRVDAILTQIAALTSDLDISPTNATELHRLLTYYTAQASIIGPGIIDRNGILIASAVTDPAPSLSLKERKIFRVHADNPDVSRLFISVPTQGGLTKEWSIQFSRPLRNKAGTFQESRRRVVSPVTFHRSL